MDITEFFSNIENNAKEFLERADQDDRVALLRDFACLQIDLFRQLVFGFNKYWLSKSDCKTPEAQFGFIVSGNLMMFHFTAPFNIKFPVSETKEFLEKDLHDIVERYMAPLFVPQERKGQ